MSFAIRLATAEDLPALRALIPDSVRALSAGFYTPAQIESGISYAFGVDTQLIDDGTYFVVEESGTIFGCGGWSRRRKIYGGDQVASSDDAVQLDPATEAARVRAFFVHPHFTRRGIGSAILHECGRAALAAGFRRLELVGTLPGEPLYRAFGFAVSGYEDGTLPDGVVICWVRMTRDIAPGDFAD